MANIDINNRLTNVLLDIGLESSTHVDKTADQPTGVFTIGKHNTLPAYLLAMDQGEEKRLMQQPLIERDS